MKRLILLLSGLYCTILMSAQAVDEVTLVVSGDGATKEEATHVALRSAIEQAYGVFVSANTEILNDELVKDEIATITSGNVKSFKELNSATLHNGKQTVTLQAVVSTKKLAAYAQSKGASCEFAGATFGANLKLIKLNQENTKKAFDNLIKQCAALAPYIYEIRLLVGDPTVDGEVKMTFDLYSTETMYALSDLIISTLDALKLTPEQVNQLEKMKVGLFPLSVVTCHYGSFKYSYYTYTEMIWDDSNIQPQSLLGQYNERILKEYDVYEYDHVSYYYAEFPGDNLTQAIAQNLPKPVVTTNIGDKWSIADAISKQIVLGSVTSCYGKTINRYVMKEDYSTSCYYFSTRTMRLPYSYIAPPKSKQSKDIPYDAKQVGQYKVTLKIPFERLVQISNFEIKYNE